ncbi:MAG: 6,7-dimethyl-8-ribityllumazine synthase [Burkholderiales bacterium]
MFGADKGQVPAQDKLMDGSELAIAIVQSRFNAAITEALLQACTAELAVLGVTATQIHTVQVPGALEIPVALQALAESNKYDALIALGCIIRGETYHFELVANESAAGISRLALDYQLPIINTILTTENTTQAVVRQTEKGRDAARCAVEMANLLHHLA